MLFRKIHLSFISFLLASLFILVSKEGLAETSKLWGTAGETWSASGRLPDFSFAGYESGMKPIPDVPRSASVKDFGAKGDGRTDDTEAFLEAIQSAKRGAI